MTTKLNVRPYKPKCNNEFILNHKRTLLKTFTRYLLYACMYIAELYFCWTRPVEKAELSAHDRSQPTSCDVPRTRADDSTAAVGRT